MPDQAQPSDDENLTLADIDPGDDRQLDAWNRLEEQRAAVRIREAVRDLQAEGIIDAAGKSLRTEVSRQHGQLLPAE